MGETLSERISLSLLQRKYDPVERIVKQASYEVGPQLFEALINAGPWVVDIKHRAELNHLLKETKEHTFSGTFHPVQSDVIRMTRPEVEPPKPPAKPWWQRCATWIREEWHLAGTDPGERYVP